MKREALIIAIILIATVAIITPIIFDISLSTTGKAVLENTGCNYEFIRGDVNHDGTVNYFDSQFLLNYLFSGGESPDCFDAADANNDNNLDIGDVASLNDYSANGIPLQQPFPNPGTDEPCDYIDNDNDSLKDEGCIRKCIESDRGKNYSLNGSVKEIYGTSKSEVSDSCNRNTNELWEWYCSPTNFSAYVIYQCPDLCKEGACVSSTIATQQNTSQNQTQNQTQNNTSRNQTQNQTQNNTNQSTNQTQNNTTIYRASNQTQNSTNQSYESINITIISPSQGSNIKAGVIQYKFKIESQDEISVCLLSINELVVEELDSVIINQQNIFSHNTPKGTYRFYITCIDSSGYFTSSDEITFSVYEEESGSTSEGSSVDSSDQSSSAGSTNTEESKVSISEKDLEQGVIFDLSFDETIALTFNNSEYSFGLTEIQEDSVTLILTESQKEIKLDLNKETEIDLDNDGISDILVTVDEIGPSSLSMQIKSSQSAEEKYSAQKTKSNAAIFLTAIIISTIMIVTIIITLMLISQSRKRSNLEKSLKEYA